MCKSQGPFRLRSNSHFEVLAGIGGSRDLQALEHEVQQMLPALKQEVARQGLQVLKEGLPGRRVLFAMAIVMFEMIAFGFQGVVVRVLDFPAGSSGLHDGLHARAI